MRFDRSATCASGLPVSVGELPYCATIDFFTSGVSAMGHSFYIYHEASGSSTRSAISRFEPSNSNLEGRINLIESDFALDRSRFSSAQVADLAHQI